LSFSYLYGFSWVHDKKQELKKVGNPPTEVLLSIPGQQTGWIELLQQSLLERPLMEGQMIDCPTDKYNKFNGFCQALLHKKLS
jgi:hypothetical protein